MARYIMTKRTFKTFKDTKEILVYNEKRGIYEPEGRIVIDKMAESILADEGLGRQATNGYMISVAGHIQRLTYTDRNKFNSKPYLLNLSNGVYNLKTKKFLDHSPDFLFTIRIPIEYDPDADCPKIRKFLSEIVQEKNIPLLEEIFGWCLDLDSPIQKAIVFVGEGANGKSTFLNVLVTFLGRENCVAVTLQSLSKNRFDKAQLFGKMANIHPDLPATLIADTSVIKALTGGDSISAEKKFQDGFTFVNKAKQIFSANQLPVIDDESLAIWRRIILVTFPNRFLGDNVDKEILKKLTTPKELSGLLNIALEGLARIQEKEDFTYIPSVEATREKYVAMSDPIRNFIETQCQLDSWKETPKPKLFKAYGNYCALHKIPVGTNRAFGRSLKKKYRGTIGERQNNWTGIVLRREKAVNAGE